MKTIFRTILVAGAVVMTAACGNTSSKNTEAVAVPVADPTVSVAQVFVREVPQEAVYTSTVQAYVKNNIAPQMAGYNIFGKTCFQLNVKTLQIKYV